MLHFSFLGFYRVLFGGVLGRLFEPAGDRRPLQGAPCRRGCFEGSSSYRTFWVRSSPKVSLGGLQGLKLLVLFFICVCVCVCVCVCLFVFSSVAVGHRDPLDAGTFGVLFVGASGLASLQELSCFHPGPELLQVLSPPSELPSSGPKPFGKPERWRISCLAMSSRSTIDPQQLRASQVGQSSPSSA